MARTTVGNVKEVITTNATDKQVDEIIKTANLLVNTHLSDQGLSANLLADIEKWLTAHLLALTFDRQAEQKKVGDASEKYAALGQGLKSTTYGQIVISLDSSGMLSNANKQIATIRVVPQFDDSDLL